MKTLLEVKAEFMDDLPTYLAIHDLIEAGLTKTEAEATVEEWELQRARARFDSWRQLKER